MTALLLMPGRDPVEVTLPDHGTVTIQTIPGVGPVQFARTTAYDALGRAIFTLPVPQVPPEVETLWSGGDLAELGDASTGLGQVTYEKGSHGHTPRIQAPSKMPLSRWALSPVPWDRYRPDYQRQTYGRKP